MYLSIIPWNLRAWLYALRLAGYAGAALICLQIAEFGQFNGGQATAHSSMLALAIFRGPFTFFALILLFAKPSFARVRRSDFCAFFLAFSTYFLLSTMWSEDRVATFGKAVELFIGLLIILRASRGARPFAKVDALRRLLLLVISLLGFVALIGYFAHIPAFVNSRPSIMMSTSAQAPFLSGNGLGYVSSLLLLSVFGEWQSGCLSRRQAMPQMAYASLMFLCAASRTSLIIIALGLAIILYRRSKALFSLYCVSFGAGIGIFWNQIMKVILGDQVAGNFDTLSGRTVMWASALERWKERPLFGFGGGVGGKYVIAHLGDQSLEVLSSLHDGFLELLTGLGSVGFLIAILLLCAVSIAVYRRWKTSPSMGGTYILIVHIWITSLMSIGILAWMGYEMLFYIILIGILDIQRRETAVASASGRFVRPLAHSEFLSPFKPIRERSLH